VSDRPHATVLYHYFHPDDVVSARHLSDLAEGLGRRGWDVTALPCHRGCRDESKTYPRRERWNGIDIRRVWRPNLKQASAKGRILNAAWMLAAWGWHGIVAPRRKREVMIVGTDPILSPLAALPWGFFRRRCRVAHWCFDLYPEAPIAEGMIRESHPAVKLLESMLSVAYKRCSLMVDLGACMGRLLAKYGSKGKALTLPPWALVEPKTVSPPDPATRRELFGDAKIGLLYSGNFGLAHTHAEFLALARKLRGESIAMSFACRGNRLDPLKAAVQPDDTNVRFAGFAPESELEKRLGACDLHLVSLRADWTGTVVPSKFFGALATGRGVIFAGSPDSAIAGWIREHDVGWVLTDATMDAVVADLKRLAADPAELLAMRDRCHAVYQRHFSKEHLLDRWDAELRAMIGT
jgi:glycosyltransferase involved in cell wall biosynthesis